MEITTRQLGNIVFKEEEVLNFKEGLYGFEDLKRFVIVEGEKGSLFSYLQCMDDLEITFIIANPREIIKDYLLTISEKDIESLGMKSKLDMVDYVIITIPENIEEISANLLGPVIVNKKNRWGKQVISLNPNYTTKYQILSELKNHKIKVG